MFGSWALTTPYHGGPDEPEHAVRAAGIVRGEVFGDEVDADDPVWRSFTSPVWVYHRVPGCFAFEPRTPAYCTVPRSGDGTTGYWSSAAGYPPTAHVLAGLPTLWSGVPSGLMAARSVDLLVPALLLAASLAMVARRGPPLRFAAVVLVATPMLFFTGAVVNPSGWLMAGAIAVTVGLLGLADDARWSRSGWLAVLGLLAMLFSRPDGLLWGPLVVLVCAVASGGRLRTAVTDAPRSAVGLVTVTTLGAAIWRLVAPSDLITVPVESTRRWLVLVRTAGDLGDDLRDAIAGIAWGDVPIWGPIVAAWVAAVAGLVVIAVRRRDRSTLVAAAIALAAFCLVPIALTGWRYATAGYFWQGRYSYPILAAGVIVLAWGTGAGESARSRWERAVLWLALGAAFLGWQVTFASAMRRWSGWDISSHAPWDWAEWGAPVPAVTGWLLHLVGSVVVLACGLVLVRGRPQPGPVTDAG